MLINRKYFLWILLAVFLLRQSASSVTYVVFRYDDFSGDQPGARQIDSFRSRLWEAEQQVDATFAKYSVPYVIAIIPYANPLYGGSVNGQPVSLREDTEKVDFIRKAVTAKRVQVAQHGYSHTNFAGDNQRHGEFRNRSYQTQLKDIEDGRQILLNVCGLSELSTFVPPWNAWDSNTAHALQKCSFRILSADRYYYHSSAANLTMLPYTAVPANLEEMVEKDTLPEDGIVVVLYHPQEILQFEGKAGDLYFGIERFDRLLNKLSKMPNVRITTLEQLAEEPIDLSLERYIQANHLWRLESFWSKLLPKNLWPGTEGRYLYLDASVYAGRFWQWGIATIILILAVLILGVFAFYLCTSFVPKKLYLWLGLPALLIFLFSVLAQIHLVNRGYHITGVRTIPICVSLGFLVALIVRKYFTLWRSNGMILGRQKELSK